MKYCTYCGEKLFDEAVVCPNCGCPVDRQNVPTTNSMSPDGGVLLNTLSQRININGIIWFVIGVLQILGGVFINWVLLVVGVLNIISAVQDMQYSKTLFEKPSGTVAKFESLTGPVITLLYNLVVGGVVGVAGSIYYFLAIRNYVMENKLFFAGFDTEGQN